MLQLCYDGHFIALPLRWDFSDELAMLRFRMAVRLRFPCDGFFFSDELAMLQIRFLPLRWDVIELAMLRPFIGSSIALPLRWGFSLACDAPNYYAYQSPILICFGYSENLPTSVSFFLNFQARFLFFMAPSMKILARSPLWEPRLR